MADATAAGVPGFDHARIPCGSFGEPGMI